MSDSVRLTYEKLLQFLIAIVDAKLFETVASENLEPVDVEDANDGGVGHVGLRRGGVNCRVHLAHDPREQPVIQRLHSKLFRIHDYG